MAFIELEMRSIKEIPASELDELSCNIRGNCDHNVSRTVVYLLVSIFSKLFPVFGFREIGSISDQMGSMNINLHLISGDYYLKLDYEHSITGSFHHVEIDRFIQGNHLPPGISLRLDLDLTTNGWMTLYIYGIDERVRGEVIELAGRCFEKVKHPGEPDQDIQESVKDIQPVQDPGPSIEVPVKPVPVTPLDKLIAVFDEERNGYMEWHDGPSLHEVDYVFSGLAPEDKVEASELVAARIRKGYNAYLGRAAELLATEECRAALNEALHSTGNPYTASNIARNLLAAGESSDAIEILKLIVENRDLGWSVRIDALVNLKIAMDSAGDKRPLSDFISPELEVSIFEAVADDDYLVRYHAAETILKLAGIKKDLSLHKELFSYICGKHPFENKPSKADRAGFGKAAEILRMKLMR